MIIIEEQLTRRTKKHIYFFIEDRKFRESIAESLVEGKLIELLPGYWKLKELVEKSADAALVGNGTGLREKFSATVELDTDLFVQKEKG